MPEHLKPFCKPFANRQNLSGSIITFIDSLISATHEARLDNLIGDKKIDRKCK